MTFPKFHLGLVFWNFVFIIPTRFCRVRIFSRPCVIFCVSAAGIMNMSFAILVAFESKGLEKTYIHFSNNTFPIGTVIINLGNYIWRI